MADILQVTTPITPRDYQMPNRQNQQSQTVDSGQVFNLGDQTRIVQTNDRSGDSAEQDLKDTGLTTPDSASGTRSTTSTIDTVKELISPAAMAAIREKGDAALLSKISAFAEEVVLKPENLVRDMINQQENATIFSGKMWDALRDMLNTDSEEMKSAIMDFVKAAADNASKDELLESLSSNFRFLATELAPSKAVSEELMKASEALTGPDAARNFTAIKSTLVQLVNYTENSLLLDNKTQNLLPLIIHNMSRYSNNPSALRETFDTILNLFDNINYGEKQLGKMAEDLGIEPQNASAEDVRSALEKSFDDFIIAGRLPQDVKKSSIINSETLREQSRLEDMTKLLSIGVGSMAKRLDTARLKNTLSGINTQRGSAAIKLAVASVTPNTPAMADALNSIISNYDKTNDLQSLIDRLGTVLNSVDDLNKKIPLAHVLNEALANLAEKNNSNYKPPTSIDILSDFLLKNINDPSLHSITSLNRSDMIQTMLTSPGVFNPLMHFFVPIDAYGMRAFAELWVDRNAEKSKRDIADSDGDTSHVFMCFDMEDVGYFEMEMFARGDNLSVMLLCPEGKENAFETLKTAVPRIAAGAGYTVGTTIVDTLYKKRSLNKVFSRLSEIRGDFNAKA